MHYILGIHAPLKGHNTGFCLTNLEGEILIHCENERLSRIKNDPDFITPHFNPIPYIYSIVQNQPIHIFFTESYESTLQQHSLLFSNFNVQQITSVPHHIAHAYSVLPFYPELKNLTLPALVADGSGFDNQIKLHSLLGSFHNLQFTTILQNPVPSTNHLSWFLGPQSAGKLMGLAGYYPDVQPKQLSKHQVFLHKNANSRLHSEQTLKELAAHYKYTIDDLKKHIKQLFPSPIPHLLIAGGSFLSLELNTWIYNNITPNLYYSPATSDSGLPLGATNYGYFSLTNKSLLTNNPFLNTNLIPSLPPNSISPKQLASLLANQQIIGLIRGNSEIGPRALGHRSILAYPNSQNFQKVSIELKRREFFRPLAPIVTDQQFDQLFQGPKGSFMQYAVHCNPITQQSLPAICHKDLTSRPQVITQSSDPWLYEMLVELGKLTGFQCAINTSLNKKKPITHNYQHALQDFTNLIPLLTSDHSP